MSVQDIISVQNKLEYMYVYFFNCMGLLFFTKWSPRIKCVRKLNASKTADSLDQCCSLGTIK